MESDDGVSAQPVIGTTTTPVTEDGRLNDLAKRVREAELGLFTVPSLESFEALKVCRTAILQYHRDREDAANTAGQLLAEEVEDIDKQVTNLMLSVNDALHLILAQISVEQSTAGNKLAEQSAEKAERIAKVSGRATFAFSLVAAFYLPPTLATGIFGMNINLINGAKVDFWWPIVVFAVLQFSLCALLAFLLGAYTLGDKIRARMAEKRVAEKLRRGDESHRVNEVP
ncbi:unnamed protein product [Zymoseptoria tritici ST99CH_3D1]|nr:unnamed protein product [Zymoseptoria tritici ST99CH_3D1]